MADEERHAELRAMFLAGMGDTEIAIALGVSRNMVIGRRFRLGLKTEMRPQPAAPAQQAQEHPQPTKSVKIGKPSKRRPEREYQHDRVSQKVSASAAAQIANLDDLPVPMSRRVTIIELERGMCVWPLGDPTSPEFRYCGSDAPGGQCGSYCTHHARMAFKGFRAPSSNRTKPKVSALSYRR